MLFIKEIVKRLLLELLCDYSTLVEAVGRNTTPETLLPDENQPHLAHFLQASHPEDQRFLLLVYPALIVLHV